MSAPSVAAAGLAAAVLVAAAVVAALASYGSPAHVLAWAALLSLCGP